MIKATLKSIQILDPDGTISLSNITLVVSLVMVAAQPRAETIAAFVAALANFNLKKWFALKRASKDAGDRTVIDGLRGDIERLQREFEKLNAAMTFSKMSR